MSTMLTMLGLSIFITLMLMLYYRLESLFAADIDLTGSWHGYYQFGKQYSALLKDKKVKFVAAITVDSERNFTGTIKEAEEGIPETSRIEGKIKGRTISFTKTYANSYGIDGDGVRLVREGPMYIMYSGTFDRGRKQFQGDWKIEAVYVFENGRERTIVNTGYWAMKKMIDKKND